MVKFDLQNGSWMVSIDTIRPPSNLAYMLWIKNFLVVLGFDLQNGGCISYSLFSVFFVEPFKHCRECVLDTF